eukprot:TRINITY_DN7958_c0_g2_i4.p1 TRINITY_DN7958_c0_g2~~TRINITY_DN7958_c0_g2_i4.p1  ORF type:complete len:181 (+),score=26.86 TRINITY_DN7958_c0_g2_i4:1042-1584(+)
MAKPITTCFFLLLASAIGVENSKAYSCPGSPAFVHASAKVTATFRQNSCAEVRQEMLDRINEKNGWVDPHNGGTYTLLSDPSAEVLQVERETGDKKYVDKMDFTFAPLKGDAGSCELMGCSESQVTSFLDFSTNFCNIHDLYCGRADGCPIANKDFVYTEQVHKSMGAGDNKKDCIKSTN